MFTCKKTRDMFSDKEEVEKGRLFNHYRNKPGRNNDGKKDQSPKMHLIFQRFYEAAGQNNIKKTYAPRENNGNRPQVCADVQVHSSLRALATINQEASGRTSVSEPAGVEPEVDHHMQQDVDTPHRRQHSKERFSKRPSVDVADGECRNEDHKKKSDTT